MNKLILAVLLMSTIFASHAEVYKWTDSQGVIHFSDSPHDGAETVKLPQSQTYSPSTPQKDLEPQHEEELDAVEHKPYTKIAITQPHNEETIRNNQGVVSVSVALEPALAQGDKVQLLFDGSPLGDPKPNLSFELNGINRGSHTITVKVLNSNGEELITSDTITIFMQRPRVNMS